MIKNSIFELPRNGSQYGQAFLIGELLYSKPGYYVDVGARCGKAISNTRFLEKKGWSGVCIEPHPDLFSQLKENRSCNLVNCAASSHDGALKFVKLLEEPFGNSGLLETFPNPNRLSGMRHEIIEVEVKTLDRILTDIGAPEHIQYLDVDVEGHEEDVLEGLDLNKYKIDYIGIECRTETPKFDRINKRLRGFGYIAFANIGSDIFFMKRDGASND